MQLGDISWSDLNPFKSDISLSDLLTGPINTAVITKGSNASTPTLDYFGTKTMQNTSDFNSTLSTTDLSPAAAQILRLSTGVDTTSPVIPDFLKSATSLNTTVAKPSAGQLALAKQQASAWYQNKTTLMIVGGVALAAAAAFVFTGNKRVRTR